MGSKSHKNNIYNINNIDESFNEGIKITEEVLNIKRHLDDIFEVLNLNCLSYDFLHVISSVFYGLFKCLQSESVLLESLKRLQLMNLPCDVLKEMQIGSAVTGIKRDHHSKEIRDLAGSLIDGWKRVADDWVKFTEYLAVEENGLPSSSIPDWLKSPEPSPPIAGIDTDGVDDVAVWLAKEKEKGLPSPPIASIADIDEWLIPTEEGAPEFSDYNCTDFRSPVELSNNPEAVLCFSDPGWDIEEFLHKKPKALSDDRQLDQPQVTLFQKHGSKPLSAEKSAERTPSRTLFVTNIPCNTRERDLKRHFSPYGVIRGVRIPKSKKKNYAFVEYNLMMDAVNALEVTNNSKFRGQVLRVDYSSHDADNVNRRRDRGNCYREEGEIIESESNYDNQEAARARKLSVVAISNRQLGKPPQWASSDLKSGRNCDREDGEIESDSNLYDNQEAARAGKPSVVVTSNRQLGQHPRWASSDLKSGRSWDGYGDWPSEKRRRTSHHEHTGRQQRHMHNKPNTSVF